MPRAHDVIVVGGGPVGMLLGCLLVRRGLDAIVLERRPHRSPHSRAIGIHPPGLAALDAVGLAQPAIRAGVRILGGSVSSDGRVLGSMSFRRVHKQFPFVLSLPQAQTERMLERSLTEVGPDRVQRTQVTHVIDRGECVDVVRADAPLMRARYVVAVDGVRSGIRNALGIEWRRQSGAAEYAMADFAAGTDDPSSALLFFERGGVVESFPLPGAVRRWVARLPSSAEDAATASRWGPEQLARVIEERTGHVVRSRTNTMVSVFRARQHLADRLVAGRVILAGDAAHEVSPIGGQGMNLGWRDAVVLADTLERVIADPGSAERELSTYELLRRRAAYRATRQAAFNMAMGAPRAGMPLRIRNGIVRAAATPPAGAFFARAFTMRWL